MIEEINKQKVPSIKSIETQLLIKAIYLVYGYDFRHYRQSTVQNRFEKYKNDLNLQNIADIIPLIVHNRSSFNALLLDMSITVTEMFRDPWIVNAINKEVIPQLKPYPYLNIWHAGCATGEEVYSMAILLKENNILQRSLLYGTDINDKSVQIAKNGIYPLDSLKSYTKNYNQSGTLNSLSDYYHTSYKSVKMSNELRDKITFAQHSLVNDGVFSETHLIICKNVLIYFNRQLQNKVLKLFTDSLCPRGYLCLGNTESIEFSEVINEKAKVYRKKLKIR